MENQDGWASRVGQVKVGNPRDTERQVPKVDRERAAGFQALIADEDAFRSWYDRALPRVYSFVLARCGGVGTEALELTQEIFVEAVRSRMGYDGRADPITWMCGIARNKIADRFRRRSREQRRHLALINEQIRESALREAAEEVDAREAVLAVLRTIPATQSIVLTLHYLDELPVREIARMLGRSESAVESLLTRGRESFKRIYTESEVET